MDKALIVILIIAACIWGGSKLFEQWEETAPEPNKERRTFADEYLTEDRLVHEGNRSSSSGSTKAPGSTTSSASAPAQFRATNLPGLPASLASGLASAKSAGPQSLKVWIQKNRGKVEDPALADIELDYVVAVGRENFIEAKRTYARVAERVDPSSPVYARLKSLESAYK